MRLADIDVAVATGELRKAGVVIRLERQPMAVLALLASRPGQLVTHEEIRRAVWGETHVRFPDSLHYCVRQIRLALGDDARRPTFVETIPGRGYRLLVAPEVTDEVPPRPAAAVANRRGPWLLRSAVAAALLFAALLIERQPNQHHEMVVGFLRTLHGLAF